jgi:hypothetical protein
MESENTGREENEVPLWVQKSLLRVFLCLDGMLFGVFIASIGGMAIPALCITFAAIHIFMFLYCSNAVRKEVHPNLLLVVAFLCLVAAAFALIYALAN